MILISLVGEQPAPNLLPARRLQPDVTVLVYTERTTSIADNLSVLLAPLCPSLPCKVDPYHIPDIRDTLAEYIEDQCGAERLIFNLTGGTKPMALAAHDVARRTHSPFVYFQTEGNRSCLYHYALDQGVVTLEDVEELPETITLDDYLRLYLYEYESEPPRNDLEKQVIDTIAAIPGASVLSSVRPAGVGGLEVDFAIRYGNHVGIGEVKTKGAKSGIDQLNAVAHPRYLGTYIAKFLVSARPVDRNNLDLADAYRIEVIELPSYLRDGQLSAEDQDTLRATILRRLGGAR